MTVHKIRLFVNVEDSKKAVSFFEEINLHPISAVTRTYMHNPNANNTMYQVIGTDLNTLVRKACDLSMYLGYNVKPEIFFLRTKEKTAKGIKGFYYDVEL